MRAREIYLKVLAPVLKESTRATIGTLTGYLLCLTVRLFPESSRDDINAAIWGVADNHAELIERMERDTPDVNSPGGEA